MNKTQYLLVCLGEEACESTQRATKALRFGMTEIQPGQPEHNRRRLEREAAEFVAVAEMLGLNIRESDKTAKKKKVLKYMRYSRTLWILT